MSASDFIMFIISIGSLYSLHELGHAFHVACVGVLESLHSMKYKQGEHLIQKELSKSYEYLEERLNANNSLKPFSTFDLTRPGMRDLYVLLLTLFIVLLQFKLSEK